MGMVLCNLLCTRIFPIDYQMYVKANCVQKWTIRGIWKSFDTMSASVFRYIQGFISIFYITKLAAVKWWRQSSIEYTYAPSPTTLLLDKMMSTLMSVFQLLLAPLIVKAHRWFNWQFDHTCQAIK